MISRQLKNEVNKLWDDFRSGDITNPFSVIEQISFLMFSRLLDIREKREEKKAARTGKAFRRIFSDKEIRSEVSRKPLEGLAETEQELRWSSFKDRSADEMLRIVRDGVFPHFKTLAMNGSDLGEYMKNVVIIGIKSTQNTGL